MKTIFLLNFLLLLCVSSSRAQTTVTDIDAAGLKTEFNNMVNFPRVVAVLDPGCGACAAHGNDLRNWIFSQCNNPDLRGIIVWIDVGGFGSTKSTAISKATLWSDSRVKHYWNTPTDDIPYALANTPGLGCSYAWDISLIYDASAQWTGANPPAPYYAISKTSCGNLYNINNLSSQLQNMGGCSATGIAELSSVPHLDISSYPNPAENHRVNLHITSRAGERMTVQITDLTGRLVYSENFRTPDKTTEREISTGNIPEGMYLLRVIAGDKSFSQKILFQ